VEMPSTGNEVFLKFIVKILDKRQERIWLLSLRSLSSSK